jgi:amino acid adenylation domain-containing protein/thioester reductase-like protein
MNQPHPPGLRLLHHRFEEHATARPDHLALVLGERRMSYRQLNGAANRLAQTLIDKGVGPETLVGLCQERSFAMIVSLLGIWKAGGAYLPLDPGYPAVRLRQVLDDARPRLLVTTEHLLGRLPGHQAEPLFLSDDQLARPEQPDRIGNPTGRVTAETLAYLMYTSGSTGRPKGVLIEHRGLANLCHEQERFFGMRPEDRVLALSSLCFDASVFEMAMALGAGATLCLIPSPTMFSGATLLDVLQRQRISCLTIVPSLLRLLPGGPLPDLRTIIAAGEACPAELVDRWATADRRFFNAYGPTETTVWATIAACRPGEGKPTIGRPIGGTYAHVLDDQLRPGTAGELYLGGLHLARGYLDDPKHTAERFIVDPFAPPGRLYKTGDRVQLLPDGRIDFLGRTDDQIKLRGFRIDPAEIEQALGEHPAIRQSLVRAFGAARKVLVAYLVLAPGQDVDARTLRRFLEQRLPAHLVPAHYLLLEAMPITPNGKVDREALPAPPGLSRDGAPPDAGDDHEGGGLERRLARLFAAALGLETVEPDGRFFDELGGDSLAAVDLLARIEKELGLRLPMRVLFDHDTVRRMAEALQDRGRLGESPSRIDWADESQLEPTLASLVRGRSRGPNFLLTGATGFVGAFLVKELLCRTDARLHCLVRARDRGEAFDRLRAALRRYGIWSDGYQDRIEAVAGELTEPELGLAGPHYQSLASLVDGIYHCAAAVNFVYPYRRLKAVNVDGTKNLIRFACQGRAKSLHHISSLAVYGSVGYFGNRQIPEEELRHIDTLYMGYAESKAVAEALVRDAGRSGLPVTVYRLDDVIGHSETGVWNTSDFICRYLKGALQLEMAPNLDIAINAVPVDTVARILCHLSLSPGAGGRCFNVFNPHGVSQGQLFEYFRQRGHHLRVVDYREWQQRLADLDRDNALRPLVSLFTETFSEQNLTIPEMYEEGRRPRFSDANLRAGLAGSDITIPRLDEPLLARYYRYFLDSGFLPPPAH